MSNLLATYDPQAVQIQLNGENVTGFADGDMVTVSRNEDFTTEMVGTKGEVTRAVNRNSTATITLRLQHTSPFVKRMIELGIADNFLGIPPILDFRVIDPSSSDAIVAAQVWIKSDTDHGWGNETGTREYTLFAVNYQSAPNGLLAASLAYAQTVGLL